MRLRDAAALHIGFWVYLIGGGGMFYWLESDAHNNLTNTGKKYQVFSIEIKILTQVFFKKC
jgi:hypothetical protein